MQGNVGDESLRQTVQFMHTSACTHLDAVVGEDPVRLDPRSCPHLQLLCRACSCCGVLLLWVQLPSPFSSSMEHCHSKAPADDIPLIGAAVLRRVRACTDLSKDGEAEQTKVYSISSMIMLCKAAAGVTLL